MNPTFDKKTFGIGAAAGVGLVALTFGLNKGIGWARRKYAAKQAAKAAAEAAAPAATTKTEEKRGRGGHTTEATA